jgi:hypothetical protein
MGDGLVIDSLARGDSHMIARFNDAWAAAVAERADWGMPWDVKPDDAPAISTEAVERVAAMFCVIADAWTRHLLREAGVGPNDRPPPTSSQQRTLIRLIHRHQDSDDRALTLLTTWARWLLTGQVDKLQLDCERLAGDMIPEILLGVLNHVRETSPQYNGKALVQVDSSRASGGANA